MSMKLVAVVVLGAAVVAAAAGGGYVALRRNAADVAAASMPADTAVGTTEGTVEAAEPAPFAAEPAAPARANAIVRLDMAGQPVAPRPSEPTPVVMKTEPSPASQPAPPETAPPAVLDMARIIAVPMNDPAFQHPVELSKPPADELTVARDSVLGIRLDSTVSSETARVEDRVAARVTRDVTVDGHTAISSGTRLEGVVSSVERGGKFKDRARIGVRFHSLILADNTRLPIETETIFRERESPANDSAAKVGASAAIGGILGALIGGKKGAAIGATMGAAGGTAAVMNGAPQDVVLPAGTPLTVRLTAPITLSIPRQE